MSATSQATIVAHGDPIYKWKTVLQLSLAFGLVGLDRWIVAPLTPAIMADSGLKPLDLNNLVAVLGVAWRLAAIFLGSLSDRVGRRKVPLPVVIAFSPMSGLSGAAGGFVILLLIRALMGVAKGAFGPTCFAATAEAS